MSRSESSLRSARIVCQLLLGQPRPEAGSLQLSRVNLGKCPHSFHGLFGADLSGANLSGANLKGANLSEADFRGANLIAAILDVTDLSGANLSGANLERANRHWGDNYDYIGSGGVNLSRSDLRKANLIFANLGEADLRGAALFENNLRGADLSGAYLRDVEGVTRARLERPAKSLEGAIMPTGQRYEE